MSDYARVVDFIHEMYGSSEFVPLSVPKFIGNEKKYLNECIDTTFVSSVGKFVDRFEEEMARYTGAKKAVVCVSGTNALHMSLLLVGVERDDEVLTQALTFVATCNALSYIGAHPVFIDVDRETMGLSPLALRVWLEKNAELKNGVCHNKRTGRRVKACVPMHTFGHPVKLDELVDVCQEWHIELVEDAAESIGSLYKRRHTGIFGKVGAISFNGNKTITTGGGGMMLFQDEEMGKLAKHITTQAKVPHRWEFRHDHIGYNYRMSNICAGIGRGQMTVANEHISHHKHIQKMYEELLADIKGVTIHSQPSTGEYDSNYWLCTITLDPALKVRGQENAYQVVVQGAVGGAAGVTHEARELHTDCEPNANVEAMRIFLDTKGIESRPLWKPMHKQPVYADADAYVNGVSEKLFKVGMCLPSGPCVTDDEVRYIVECIKEAILVG